MSAQFEYGPLRITADELLARFGRPMILNQADMDDVYDPITGDWIEGPMQPVDIPVFGVTLAPTAEYSASVGFESIETGDMLVYIQATGKPTLSSKITVDDVLWEIVNIQPVQPAEIPLMYILQVRQ